MRQNGVKQHMTLLGVKYKSIFEKKINPYNTIIIDESFAYDITLSFPEYIFNVCKLLNSLPKDKFDKISKLNNELVYNKSLDNGVINDLIILTRKSEYKSMSIPDVDKNGAIRIIHANYSENIISQISLKTKNLKDYEKLRAIIFNTTTLPYVRSLIF